MTKSHSQTLFVVVILLFTSSFAAAATCSVPSSAGVNICTPGNGQTVNYPAEITAAAAGNAPISKMAVYVDNSRIYFGAGNKLDIVDGNVRAGAHRLTVRAWDTAGTAYSASSTFTVVGGTIASCKATSPGIKFCSPANGSYQPMNDITVMVGAAGNGSRITRLKVYWGSFQLADTTSNSVTLSAGDGPGKQTMTAKAWDAAGHAYSTSTTFTTYYDRQCSDFGCSPGVVIQSPADNSTVATSFHLSANVDGNPSPITSIKAYLDGNVVAQSGGSILSAEISTTPGTHRLTVQATDRAGYLYRTVYTIIAR